MCLSSRMLLLVGVASLVAVASLSAGKAEAGKMSAKAKRVYELVMEKVTAYHGLNEPKVMAICIDWNAPNFFGFYVHNVFVTYVDMATDAPVFITKLRSDSEWRCRQWRKSQHKDCLCQTLDMNGVNVLEAPGE